VTFLKRYYNVWRFLLFVLLVTVVQAILNLIFNFNIIVNQLISLISIGLYIFVDSYKKGKHTEKEAYKVGFVNGAVYDIVLYLIGLPFLVIGFSLKRFIYFLIIVVVSVLGAVLGINKKTH
jgi:putative membrane protein (TIGR04086 family)